MGQNGSGLQPPSLGVVFWKVLMSQDEHFIILEVLAVQETSLNEECLKSTPPTPPGVSITQKTRRQQTTNSFS